MKVLPCLTILNYQIMLLIHADALSDLADNGYLRIYDGTQMLQQIQLLQLWVLLAELRFNADAAPGCCWCLTFNAITQDSNANNTGTASWFQVR